MTVIAAKPTVYHGTRFRSRLEARWARFFDAIGREWIYEPSVPELDGLGYQPDFLVSDYTGDGLNLFEIKANSSEVWDNVGKWEGKWKEVPRLTGVGFYVIFGSPGEWSEGRLARSGNFVYRVFPDKREEYGWAECPACDHVGCFPHGKPTCHTPTPSGALYRAFEAVRDQSYEDIAVMAQAAY